jgi:acyl-CoA synthetase (AMP-forming)/AMP-acid ligase II
MAELQVGGELDISTVLEGIGGLRPDEDCLVFRDRRISWAAFTERTRRLANALVADGLGVHAERSALAGHESGQDHLAVYLQNGVEYLECMAGAWKARVAPFNVNYRYVADELRYLLADADARAIVVHSRFAPTLAAILPETPGLRTIIQVPDDSGHDLLPGARWYEDVLAASSPERPPVTWSPDDLYILYTGGTTGMPKGVMWRNGDAMVECFSGSPTARTLDDFLAEADVRFRALITPPFMHGAGHWVAFRVLLGGGTVCLPSEVQHLDPDDVWRTVERQRADFMLIVGDAFARPLLDQLERADYELSSLNVVLSGGAALSKARKEDLLGHLPTVMIVDGMGSSEAGGQLAHVSTASGASTGSFPPRAGTHVLSAALDRELTPGEDEVGWLAKSGRLALGYLGDGDKTARTYPIVDGVRYAVPGDRARLLADGSIEMHGRDAVTINSGGEKIFAEEVEAAVKAHPDVYDCVVTGRPSERWGNEVVAVVALRPGAAVTHDDLREEAGRHLARYKLPKATVFVDAIVRSPAGKADYRWAREVAATARSAAPRS